MIILRFCSHFIFESVFFASLRVFGSIVIYSRSMRSIAAARLSLFLSANAYAKRPSISLLYLSQTRYLFPFAITSSLTNASFASSIAF